MSFDEENLDEHYLCGREIQDRDNKIKDLESQLTQAREEIATIKHDLRLTQDAHIEALGERDQAREEIVWWKEKAKGSLDMANQAITERDDLKAKLSKLERVRVAAELFKTEGHKECGRNDPKCPFREIREALAALREEKEI